MKWLVFSDSHGRLDYMRQAIEAERPDKVLHLGDVVRDARELRRDFPALDIEIVRGNCDGYSGDNEEPEEKEIFLEGKRIWMLHGHTYQVKLGIGAMLSEARTRGADAVLFGHTHDPVCFREGSLWVMNPGTSRGIPQATYGIIEGINGDILCRTANCPGPKGEKRGWFF